MNRGRLNRFFPILTLVLILGLAVTFYIYNDTRTDLKDAQLYSEQISAELLSLTESYEDVSTQIEVLSRSNSALEVRISELEAKPDIVLDIDDVGDVKNIILLIGDGMGMGQLMAAELMNGDDDLVIRSLPYKSLVTSYPLSAYVTDSAAAATALATGYKTVNGAISMLPNGTILTTVLEVAEAQGMSTGVVTTTRVTHATPASFMAHISSRNSEYDIARQVLDSGVDVVLGGGSNFFSGLDPSAAGYTVVDTTSELMGFGTGKLLGLFNGFNDYMSYNDDRDPELEPSIAEMTRKSIELLSGDPDGFFLMVEGGQIDGASHDNDFDNTLSETYAFDDAVLEALEFASMRDDTLVIVTADHETGGLLLIGGYEPGDAPQYKWASGSHTESMVPVYAFGPGAVKVMSFMDNTDIGRFLIGLVG